MITNGTNLYQSSNNVRPLELRKKQIIVHSYKGLHPKNIKGLVL